MDGGGGVGLLAWLEKSEIVSKGHKTKGQKKREVFFQETQEMKYPLIIHFTSVYLELWVSFR